MQLIAALLLSNFHQNWNVSIIFGTPRRIHQYLPWISIHGILGYYMQKERDIHGETKQEHFFEFLVPNAPKKKKKNRSENLIFAHPESLEREFASPVPHN
jgi:hypothetical protein